MCRIPPVSDPLTLLYDLDCGFCRWSVAQLLQRDPGGRLRPVAIQSDEGQELLADVPEDRRLKSAHVVTADGRVVSGGDAFALVADEIRGGRPLALLARTLPGPVRLVYGQIAGNRSKVSKLVSPERKAAADAILRERGGLVPGTPTRC